LGVSGTIAGPKKVPVQTVDNQDGTYTLSYTPEQTGLYTFTAAVDKQKIGGAANPFPFMVVPAAASAEHTVAYGDGKESAQVGKNNEFTVEARDRFNNPLTSGGADVAGALTTNEVVSRSVPLLVKDNDDGTYTCSYPGVTQSGVYSLLPTLEGAPVKDAPFKLEVYPGDISVDNTDVAFPDVNISGLEGPIITLRDDQLNTRKTGGDRVVAEIRRKTRLPPVKARDNGDGTYEIDYPASLKGQHEAAVTVNGKDAPGGPWNIDVEGNVVGEEHHARAHELMGGAGEAFLKLLHGASEAEREKILNELAALGSL